MPIQPRRSSWCVTAAVLLATTPCLASGPADWLVAQQSATRAYRIDPGPLGAVLGRFAATAGVALSFDPALTRDLSSRGLQGNYGVGDGFAALLAGTGLEAVERGRGEFTLQRRAVAATPAPIAQAPRADTRPRIAPSDSTLPAVTVTAAGERESPYGAAPGYVARRSATATKTDISLLEAPQSISVVTADQIRDQGAQSIEQSVNYTAGTVVGSNGPSTEHDYVFARGFIARQFLDGTSLYASYVSGAQLRIEPYGLERVEVLRGPGSALYGQVEPGGLVNLVSKRPTATPLREVGVQFGSFSSKQGMFDLGGPVDEEGRFAFRLTGLVRDAGSQSSYMDNNRQFIAPALTWQIARDTSLTLLAHYQKDEGGGRAQPLPVEGTLLPNPNGKVPSDRFLGEPGFDGLRREQSSIGYAFKHRFNDSTVFRQNARHSNARVNERFSLVDYYGASWTSTLRLADRYAWDNRNKLALTSVDNQFETSFATGDLRHTLLVGLDYRNVKDQWDFFSASESVIDVFNPVYGTPLGPFAQAIDERTTRRQVGFYLQDQVRWSNWLATVGLRNDRAKGRTADSLAGTSSTLDDQETTGRVALSYLWPNGFAAFAGASTSFDPVSGMDGLNRPFKPSTGRQTEASVKYQPADGSGFYTLSVFDLRQRNVLTPDPSPPPSNPWAQTQTGEIRVRGLEAEAKVRAARNLWVLASYSHFDSEITRSNAGDQGRDKPYVPRNQAAVWLDYRIAEGPLQGLELGAGVRYRSAVWGLGHAVQVPSYSLVDAALRYPLAPQTTLALNVRNLANKGYVSNCSYADGCVYGDRRTVAVSLVHGF